MTNETSSTEQSASVSGSPVDQIADVLLGNNEESETPDAKKRIEDTEAQEEQDEEQDVEEVEEETEDEEQEVTWSGALGVDESKLVVDEDGNFKAVKVKVDGQESNVDLNTLIAGYQTAKSTTQKAQALADQRRQFEEKSATALETFQKKLEEADGFIQLLNRKLMSDYEGVNWNELRMTNPAEYAAAMADFQARQADIQQMVGSLAANRDATTRQLEQQQSEQRTRFYKEQAEKTLQRFPEWGDQEKAKADFAEMRSLLKTFDFSDDEFNQISDPRILAVLKSVLDVQKSKQEAEKKVQAPAAKTPRRATRARTGRTPSKLDRLVKRAKTATGTQKRSAQTDAIAAILLEGEK